MSGQPFVWVGPGQVKNKRTHYRSFTLNYQTYHVGDCVYLYPEDEQYPPYIARITSAFVDQEPQSGTDPHCIEVKWFERRVNLEPSTKGIEESEREVFELEDTDINPIGCISGKCHIIKANNYEEAFTRCGNTAGWFFCRGYFQQSSNSFVAYTPAEMAQEGHEQLALPGGPPGPEVPPSAGPHGFQVRPGPHMVAPGAGQAAAATAAAAAAGTSGMPGGSYANGTAGLHPEEEEAEEGLVPGGPQRRPSGAPPAALQPASKRQKATGRTCVECGATSTPQWREGPMGPKTLCNACGVRYVRSQQKAAGQKRNAGGQKNGQGRPRDLTPPRAQQQQQLQQQADRVTKRGTKGFPSEQLINMASPAEASDQ